MNYNGSHTNIPDIRPGMNYDTRPTVPIPRTKRTRAKRSCDLCRKKKTRCDADVNKPCTSCAGANIECKFLVEQKKRGPATGFTKKNGYVEALESRLKRMESLLATMTNEKAADIATQSQNRSSDKSNTPIPSNSMDSHCQNDTDMTTSTTTFTYDETSSRRTNSISSESNNSRRSSISSIHDINNNDNSDNGGSVTVTSSGATGNFATAVIPSEPQHSATSANSVLSESAPNSVAKAAVLRSRLSSVKQHTRQSSSLTHKKGKGKDDTSDPWLIEDIQDNLRYNDIIDTTNEITTKLDKITIADYERTRYIGMSSGVHLLHQGLFSSNKRHRIRELPSWFVQKVNDDEEEHILIKSEALKTPPQGYFNRTSVFTATIPYINQDRLDILVETVRTLSIFDRSTLPSCILELTDDELFEMGCAFQDKALGLFDLIYKRSRISSVQTLILLTMFVEPPASDSDDTSYWFKTGMAIRMAQDLGLHRSSSGWQMPESEMELRRRIWYVTYLMDRWVAAELGRIVTISDQEFDVELPSLYEVESCHPKDFSERPFVPDLILQADVDLKKRTPIYAQFHYSVCLGQIFGQVLSGLHSPGSMRAGRRNKSLVHLLDQRLKNWKLGLPSEMLYDVGDLKHQSANSAILFLSYNCVLLLLYRPFITNQDSDDMNFAFKALSACTVAANNILLVTENMDAFTLSCIPWTISVYSIFQAALIFLHNAKGSNLYVANQGAKNLLRCSQVIRHDPCLSSTRIAIILQSIAACFSVSLEEGEPTLDETDGKIQHQRRRKRANSAAPLVHKELSPALDDQDRGGTKSSTCDELDEENRHATKHARSEFPSQAIDVDGRIAPLPPHLRHFISTRPEDMFLSSYSRASVSLPSSSVSPSSSPMDTTGLTTGEASLSYPSQDQQQQEPSTQVDLDSIQTFQLQAQHMEQLQQQQQQEADVDLGPWLPTETSTFNTFPPDSLHHQTWEQQYINHQLQHLPLLQHQSFDMTTCLSSEVPVYNMPNSVIWEDWDNFLKSNTSQ
ncbi:fungal-specific transcription factor domain-domain-containing protein [Absidia repens]|uniref:Fungal-specific transcription factor domain-domain-containing protein n=1 Tax=Absidia repens TaxID=90262 RepID=A0A1X2IH99_9FUNG|nr:fungal-specific transcription factor domain-domain-containing protein [Absidia repens]